MPEGKSKIIQIGKYYYPEHGGMETQLYNLCCHLNGKYQIEVLVANRKPTTISETVDGVKLTRVANLGELSSNPICPTMAYHLSKLNGDRDTIIQLHLPNPMAHFAYLLARPKGKLVIMWHSDIIRQKLLAKLYKSSLHRLLGRADAIIATSPNYIKHSPYLRKFAHKCVVVPLGIDTSKFRASLEVITKAEAIRNKYGARLVLFVGRFTNYKGLQGLIKVAKNINGKILLIGDGPLRNKLRSLVQRYSSPGKVVLLQNISNEDLVAYYHACDLFVLPSNKRSEAFGIVQLEAMVCGKPIVSTSLKTGVPWVNQHEETGLIVPVNDFEKLASSVNFLLDNPVQRQRFGENARRRVLNNFTLEQFGQKMNGLFKQVLNGGGIKDGLDDSPNFETDEHVFDYMNPT